MSRWRSSGDSKQSAVEQHDVRPGWIVVAGRRGVVDGDVAMSSQEGSQVTRYGGIGRVGQAELLEARLPAGGLVVEVDGGEEAIDEALLSLFASDFDLHPAADQSRSGAREINGPVVGSVRAEEDFFDPLAGSHQHGPLARLEMTIAGQTALQMMRQGKIKIVAAEDQVFSHGHAMELHLAAFACANANERKVGRAAAHVAHQNLLACRNQVLPVLTMSVDPGVRTRPVALRSTPREPSLLAPPPSR